MNSNRRLNLMQAIGILVFSVIGQPAMGQWSTQLDIDKPPFAYSETADNNRVSRLIGQLNSQERKLEYTSEHGYLRSMLAALEISESSQTLVFSKTSLQVQHISRQNPRAIYFNDDTYVGWVRGSSLMEISTDDPKLGAAFYTVDMAPWRPKVQRADYICLGCHATSLTQGIPGHTVRSVFPSVDGKIDSQKKSFITDHRSPFPERWGGWYVTGRHGDMQHMGNAFLRGGSLNTHDNGNRRSLADEFNTLDYLSPHSDIVALMVLEHQTQMHNTLTRADFSVRQLLFEQAQGDVSVETEEEFQAQLRWIAKEVVEQLLFCDETPLTSEVQGSLSFTGQFSRRGPLDGQGRSLREFDMKTRMFKYPCSYLIYSPAFGALTEVLQNEIASQLLAVLEGRDDSPKYRHLTPDMRSDILDILRQTKPFPLPSHPRESSKPIGSNHRRPTYLQRVNILNGLSGTQSILLMGRTLGKSLCGYTVPPNPNRMSPTPNVQCLATEKDALIGPTVLLGSASF